MNQRKLIIGILSILTCCFAVVAPAFAEGEDGIITTTVQEYDSDPVENEPVTTNDSPDTTETTETPNNQKCITNTDGSVICTTLTEDELYNGTSSEAEVVCADESEPGCSQAETTAVEDTEINPELWPMILSLSALGITIICVVILNIIGHKKTKK